MSLGKLQLFCITEFLPGEAARRAVISLDKDKVIRRCLFGNDDSMYWHLLRAYVYFPAGPGLTADSEDILTMTDARMSDMVCGVALRRTDTV